MKQLAAVFVCLLAACLADKPQPCTSPPLLNGSLIVATQNEELFEIGTFLYDAQDRKIRVGVLGKLGNQTFIHDLLLIYREGVMYEINDWNKTCKKWPLKADFHPLAIPKDAVLLGQVVIGSSSGPGQGLLVNTWTGDIGGTYMMTVTEFGCIPVTTVQHTNKFGWIMTSFFNNIIGITDPSKLNPPDFCPDAMTEDVTREPADFWSLFFNK
ncbi:ependymin-like isoform X2 [Cynoglossus semilaevis]|uniref:ependymin-like isoform X2 n=1 Tax=Cynoglossus semilaevis TaxID=244447 RepID=UPI000496F816|nr:ependymin-like isoform X2 [Cynoglossus semilaevis]